MAPKKSLIIVESPAKIKTLKKFLGSNYIFESSIGHIKDLPQKEFGIDIEHDFEPKYVTMPGKEKVIAQLKKAAKTADLVYLAPDPDREGEAIAWHILHLLPKDKPVKRISFNAITKDAVVQALEHPREIDESLVNAQQARRALDRIVGYKISPILNRRIQRGKEGSVSAGRVQSVALKLVVDREKEIAAFIPVEYWNLGALFKTTEDPKNFKASLHSVDGKRVEKEDKDGKGYFLIPDKQTADSILSRLKKGPYTVDSVDKKEKRRFPVPPFITSTLQQEASRHYGFSSARTMSVAQTLYEGVDLGNEGSEGLITYMRTDSVRSEPSAVSEARAYIKSAFGPAFLPPDSKVYASGNAAQDAHEAIRPTHIARTPESIQSYLTKEQFHLYQLIWRRFVSSQMNPAIYDTLSADIKAGDQMLILRATGSVLKFQGFLAVYEEKFDEKSEEEEDKSLPPLEEGMDLKLLEFTSEQAFTRPPPRFSEASLVKELEKSGIGRPSTYAAIMNKIQSRDYTVKESGRLKPTELGFVIAELLENNFRSIMNIRFTAEMENDLELVAENKKEWKNLLKEFWENFAPVLETAEKEAFVPKILTEVPCPECKAPLQKIWSKSKYFYGCSRYPECSFSAPLEAVEFNREDYAADFDWDQKCPNCGKEMKLRHGRFGPFLGCTQYPECKGIVNIPKKGEKILSSADMPACPAIECPGHMVMRKSRFGKTFFSCSTFPECDVIINDLDGLQDKYPSHVRTAYVKKGKDKKKTTAKEAKTAKTPKVTKKGKAAATKKAAPKKDKKPNITPSKELVDFFGTAPETRQEVLKKIWDYIKEHALQDPANKRKINPDKKLAALLGNEPIDMFKMTAVLSKHLQKE